jgi:hypothetical protein
MPRKLKVFRTMTGFHDAYVAAPSRAAALRAWGASTDLFAMGAAEEVTDPKLMEEPLSKPGEVIRQSRGSDAEHLAAAGPTAKAKGKASPASKPKPRPSRADLAKAEKRLEEAETARAKEEQAFELERAALREREEAARRRFGEKRRKLAAARQEQVDAYEAALTIWRAS